MRATTAGVEKWPSGLEDVLTRVPLMMRAPFLPAAVLGKMSGELVQLFDMVPQRFRKRAP